MTSRKPCGARLAVQLAAALLVFASSARAATAPAPPAPPASAALTATAVRDARTLPALGPFGRTAVPLAASYFSQSDTFLVSSHGFQDLAGSCMTRGWTAEDRTFQVYAHVAGDIDLINQPIMAGLPYLTISDGVGVLGPSGSTPTTIRLQHPRAIAVDASGGLIVSFEGTAARGLQRMDLVEQTIAVLGTFTDAGSSVSTAAYDPSTEKVVVSVPNRGVLLRFRGGGNEDASWRVGGGTSLGDTTADAANIGLPEQLAIDAAGNIYFADPWSHRVRMVRTDGVAPFVGRVITVAGTGTAGYSGDGGPGTSAKLWAPRGVALSADGSALYIADSENHRLRRLDLVTRVITTVAGDGTPSTLCLPQHVAVVGSDVYVASRVYNPVDIGSGDRLIRKLAGGILTTVAGGGGRGYGSPAGAMAGTRLNLKNPGGLTPDGTGGIYFADETSSLVYRLAADGTAAAVAGRAIGIAMGTQALWFGANEASAPEEVASWVRYSGYGNGWSQRFTSPPFDYSAHPSAVLAFDGILDLGSTGAPEGTDGPEFFAVQALGTDGDWVTLNVHYVQADGFDYLNSYMGPNLGRGRFKALVRLGLDGNVAPIGPITQFRIMVQTDPAVSSEDGFNYQLDGATVVDNVAVRDGDLDLVPPVDFEDGTTGTWTLSAHNGAYAPAWSGAGYTRDAALPQTAAGLRRDFDFADQTCVWTFLSPGDSLGAGAWVRLSSPWIARTPRHETVVQDSTVLITFSGKLPTINQGRFLNVWVRGKNEGDTKPLGFWPSYFIFNSGTYGGDLSSPFIEQRVLHYPQDFQTPPYLTDSIQVVFLVEDRGETVDPSTFPDPSLAAHRQSQLPYLDDIRLYRIGMDRDHDGVPDSLDACPDECAAGQDADGDGCVDATATMRHVETWAESDLPFHYRISQNGDPGITDGSDLTAVRNAFLTWRNAPGANFYVVEDPLTAQQTTSAYDGINLITFEDQEVSFSSDVIALAPTLSATRRTAYGDRIVLPGQIVDADLILNPAVSFSTPSHPGDFDLQSVVTHESGHLLGLTHSGVQDATMYFVLQSGRDATSLTADDEAAIAAAYPAVNFNSTYAAISGKVLRGSTGLPLPGALVTAVRLDAGGGLVDSVASDFSREDGGYALRRLPPGSYAVRIFPLDGTVDGLTPEYISGRLEAIAETNFAPEWWDEAESNHDDPTAIGRITLTAGEQRPGVDVITNIDTTPPTVISVSPPADSTDIRIDTALLVKFSEPVADTTLSKAFKLRPADQPTGTVGGKGRLLNNRQTFLFTPTDPLSFGIEYVLEITTALTDREGVPLAQTFHSHFSTMSQPTLAITNVQPSAAVPGSYVTFLGVGFNPAKPYGAVFTRGAFTDTVAASLVTPTSMVARVPDAATSGPANVFEVVTLGDFKSSNTLQMNVLVAGTQAAPTATGSPVSVNFAPTDVAFAPGGAVVFAVGEADLASIRMDTRTPVDHGIVGGRHLVLTPDGLRGFVTRPGYGDVVEVDTDPNSGKFGVPRDSVPVGGEPDGIALDALGRRAFVTDRSTGLISQIDTDPASVTRGVVLDQYTLPDAVLTGGIAVDPVGPRVYFTTSNQGTRQLWLPDSTVLLRHTLSSRDGAAVTPSGAEVLFPGEGGDLVAVDSSSASVGSTGIHLGGELRDVAVSPLGRSAFLVNSIFNTLQVVDVDPTSATYHTRVAEVNAGTTPVAVSISGDGTLAAVANYGSRSISLYGLSSSAITLTRLLPDIAVPGDVVAASTGNHDVGAAAQVDLGSGPFAVSRSAPTGVAFAVPSLSQRSTMATVVTAPPESERSLGLPFRVVDPISTFAPKPTGLRLLLGGRVPAYCMGDSSVGSLDYVRVSPDGKMIAVARIFNSGLGGCDSSSVDLFWLGESGTFAFGQRLASSWVISSDSFNGMDFTPDGNQLWISTPSLDVRTVNTDRSSPGFGDIRTILMSYPLIYGPGPIAADPLARFMCIGDIGRDSLLFFTVEFPPRYAGKVSIAPNYPTSLAPSPDGRFMVAGCRARAVLVDMDSMNVIAVTPDHSGGLGFWSPAAVVTSNGKRAAAGFSDGNIGVWNLDPGAGSVGTELYYGPAIPGATTQVRSLVPAPDGHSVIAALGECDSLVMLDLAVTPPTPSVVNLGQHAHTIARSHDGRQLWVANNGNPPVTRGNVRLFSLSPATTMALVSGDNQAALPNAQLPLPVRVRLTDAQAKPQEGVVVNFSLVEPGYGVLDNLSGKPTVSHVTDANGEAEVTWTMPATPGADTLRIEALGVATRTVAAQATGDDNTIAPVIVALGPQDGTTSVNAATAVYARFNQRMDSTSVAAKMQLFANGNKVPGAFSLQEQGRFVLLQPGQPLPFAAPCSVSVEAGALDHEGQTLANGGFSRFTVQQLPDLALGSIDPPAASPGGTVILMGQGFATVPGQNIVTFNGKLAQVSGATTTSLVTAVPPGAASGPVTVQVGATTSNYVNFVVLPSNPVPGGKIGDLPATQGARDVAITPDGTRAYVTNPATNSVAALSISTLSAITDITVGLLPQAIAILPDGSHAYVCNSGGNDVSVIGVDPSTAATYNKVVETITVGQKPMGVAISAIGPTVYVVNQVSGTLSVIDAKPGTATYDQVVKTVSTGTASVGVAISPDGGRVYVATAAGVVVVDLASYVVKTVSTGTAAVGVAISPDGTLAFALLGNGDLLVIDTTPGPGQYKVIKTVSTGTGSVGVAISPDGTLGYVSKGDGNTVLVYQITIASSGSPLVIVPGPAISLDLVATIEVGQSPAGMAVDPSAGKFVLVANSGSGTVSMIGFPTSLPPLKVEFDFDPNTLNLKSMGKWVTGYIEPRPPELPEDIVLPSIRLNGVVATDSCGPHGIGDNDGDGRPDLMVKFVRSAVQLALPEGDRVAVRLTGMLGTRTFFGDDTIRVKRGRIKAPLAHQVLQPGSPVEVLWEAPKDVHALYVAILHSFDLGASWAMDADHQPNTGTYRWTVPDTPGDSVKVAVALVESENPSDTTVTGALAVSDYFRIQGALEVERRPVPLQFAPIQPNPVVGPARLRFGLPERMQARLELFDVQGRRVRTLADGMQEPGWHDVRWNGETAGAGRVGAGLYFVRLKAGGREFTQRLVWLR